MVVAVGATTIEAVVEPLFQRYDVPPEAVSVAEAPEQVVPSLLAIPEVSVIETDGVGN